MASRVTYRCHSCDTEHTIEEVRRNLYLGQRTIGDYQAARRGVLGKRLARRYVTAR
jgi:hypothetical protein